MGDFDFISDRENIEAVSSDYGVIPRGDYEAEVSKAQVVPTKAGTGKMCKVEFVLLDSDHAGRKIWHNFNVQNPNDKAEKIGRGQLSALNLAVNGKKGNPDNASDLEGRAFLLSVDIEPASMSYKEKNIAVGFKSLKVGFDKVVEKVKPGQKALFDGGDDIPF